MGFLFYVAPARDNGDRFTTSEIILGLLRPRRSRRQGFGDFLPRAPPPLLLLARPLRIEDVDLGVDLPLLRFVRSELREQVDPVEGVELREDSRNMTGRSILATELDAKKRRGAEGAAPDAKHSVCSTIRRRVVEGVSQRMAAALNPGLCK